MQRCEPRLVRIICMPGSSRTSGCLRHVLTLRYRNDHDPLDAGRSLRFNVQGFSWMHTRSGCGPCESNTLPSKRAAAGYREDARGWQARSADPKSRGHALRARHLNRTDRSGSAPHGDRGRRVPEPAVLRRTPVPQERVHERQRVRLPWHPGHAAAAGRRHCQRRRDRVAGRVPWGHVQARRLLSCPCISVCICLRRSTRSS
jgi:hypothetical protein